MHFSAHLEGRIERNFGLYGDVEGKYRNSCALARRKEKSRYGAGAFGILRILQTILDNAETQITLGELPTGARLLIRSKNDWRSAVVLRFDEEKATLIVCSPNGRTYRMRRAIEAEIILDGKIPILKIKAVENWRENFVKYDIRW